MTDNELLLAISDIVGKNTKTLEHRIDRVEDSLNKRIDRVEAKIDEVDQRLSAKIDEVDQRLSAKIDEVDQRLSAKIDEVDQRLSKEVHNILLRMENIIEPRLDHIEACYISTSERYQDGTAKIEALEMNMEVVQSVVREHAKKLNAMTA
ncbi:MAG: hypothetical protein IJE49_05215 [Agathobacter sp.]|nr:hypothetical protein [Agathobacter sp.]